MDRGIGALTFRDQSHIGYTVCTADSLKILPDFEVVELDPIFSDGHAALVWSIECNFKLMNKAMEINALCTPRLTECKQIIFNKDRIFMPGGLVSSLKMNR